MSKSKQKIVSLLLAMVFAVSLLGACGAAQEQKTTAGGDGQTTTEAANAEPVPLKFFFPANEVDPAADPILLELQKRTNTTFEIATAPWDQWNDKMNLIMSSGEYIDFLCPDYDMNPWMQWAREGLLMPLDELISKEKHPYLEGLTASESFKALKVDGKKYIMPGVAPYVSWMFFLRQDWLDKLSLKMPTTPDEFYTVMEAFTKNDPDGNGKDDTVGYINTAGDTQGYCPIVQAFGGTMFFASPNGFGLGVKDGKVYAKVLTDQTLQAMKFCNKMYRNGLVTTDLDKGVDVYAKYVYSGVGGCIYTYADKVSPARMKDVPGGAKFEPVPEMIVQPGAEFHGTQGAQWWLAWCISKMSKYPEKVLELAEYCNSREGKELLYAGIKGRHYTQISEDGIIDQNTANWEADYDVKKVGYTMPMSPLFNCMAGYIPVKDYPVFEDAMKNAFMFYKGEKEEVDFIKKCDAIGTKWMQTNALTTVKLPDVDPIRAKLQENVCDVYFMKMLMAKSDAEIEKLWADFKADCVQYGSDQYIKAYQDYYDKNMK